MTVPTSFAYYPGCSLHSFASAYDASIRTVFAALGVELREIKDWNCCGTTALPASGFLFSLAVPARNLALAEEDGLDLAVACNACLVALQRARKALTAANEWSHKVVRLLDGIGRRCSGKKEVRHILDVIVNHVGLEQVMGRVRRPLAGLEAVAYYGCQLVRPRGECATPEMPDEIERLLHVLGAGVLRYDRKTRCCGSSLTAAKEQIGLELNRELLAEADMRGAKVIVVSCPLCHANLTMYQTRINERFGTRYNMPVLFFTQIMGLAFGLDPRALGIGEEACGWPSGLHAYLGEVV